jgi:hypothetical protein
MNLHDHIERLERLKRQIRFDFACNDPDNGLATGRVAQIEISPDILTLDAKQWTGFSFARCPKVRDEGSSIILAGKRWPISRSKEWIGNWCWNAYWMEPVTARSFLIWLRARDLFHATEGEASLFYAWNNPDPRAFLAAILDPSNAAASFHRLVG